MEHSKVGTLTWEACKKCKNQAGEKGCDAGASIEDLLDFEDDKDIFCLYFIEDATKR